ncbi:hypothetical protein ACXR2U_13205 [Jatrophihabitans sp. YIM 134969]
MGIVREMLVDSLVPVDGTVTIVGWTRPPRARLVLAEYRDGDRDVPVGPGFIRVHVAGDRSVFTLQLFDDDPGWDVVGWREMLGGSGTFPGMRLSCTVDRNGAPGPLGLNLPEENMQFRLYTAVPPDSEQQRFLLHCWPANPLALVEGWELIDEPGSGDTARTVVTRPPAPVASPGRDEGIEFEWDGVVGLDYGQFQIWAGEWDDETDEAALLERALESGIARDRSLLTVVVPHQNNFEMPLRVEVLAAPVPDDLDAWDEAFEASIEVDDNGLRYDSPTMGVTEIAVPAGRYRALITGAGIVARGWPGSTTPGDSWRIRLTPVTGNVQARRLKAWTPPR